MAILDSRFAGPLSRIDGDQKLFDELAAYFIEDAPELLVTARRGRRIECPKRLHASAWAAGFNGHI